MKGNKCNVGAVCSFATQLQFISGYLSVSATIFRPIIESSLSVSPGAQTSISYIVGGAVSKALSRFWTALFSAVCFGYGYIVVTVGSNYPCLCRN